jgi:hypothetical protein
LAELTGFASPSAVGANREGETWRIELEITEKPFNTILKRSERTSNEKN